VDNLTRKKVGDMPLLTGSFLVKSPGYSEKFSEILRVLLSHGGIYSPQKVDIGSNKARRVFPFDENQIEKWFLEWKKSGPVAACILKRTSPVQVLVILGKSPLHFQPISLMVGRQYFDDNSRLLEFLSIMKELYSLLHPSYGEVNTTGMIKVVRDNRGASSLGINLERALPDIYWANFLGPEYVEMFGRKKLESAPWYRIEPLSDGGILLLLTPSPFDYDKDPERFEELRLKVKEHLGADAFDSGDWHYKGKTPYFDFSGEENTRRMSGRTELAQVFDTLSTTPREQWVNLMKNTKQLALELVSEMGSHGIDLDFSLEGLRELDEHLPSTIPRTNYSTSFLIRVTAFVAEVVIRNMGGTWLFEDHAMPTNEDIPVLKVNDIYASPLERTQKVLFEGEKFEHWYRTMLLASKTP
jgi:hypothetical protein